MPANNEPTAWLQLEAELGGRDPADIETLLEELGAVAVTLRDAGDNPLLEPLPGETPLWPTVTLTALFAGDTDPNTLRAALAEQLGDQQLHFCMLREQDWQAGFEQSLEPRCFGRRLWILPAADSDLPADAVSLILQPGLAFGSGEHPTTHMCLEWLDSLQLTGERVLDFGCGSGILGLAAAALGAREVSMTDIDPQALEASRENAEANGLTGRVHVTFANKSDQSTQHDVLVANILSGTLIELGPQLNGLMRPGARMAITGILADQADAVSAAWSGWADMVVSAQIRDWVLLTGTKRMAAT